MKKIFKILAPIILALFVVALIFTGVNKLILSDNSKVKTSTTSKVDKNESKKDSEDKKNKKPEIPDLVGLDLKTAKWLIEKNKCKLGNVTYENSDAIYDTVLKQTPKAGKKDSANEEVEIDIVLSNGANFGVNETTTKPKPKYNETQKEEEPKEEDNLNENEDPQNQEWQNQNNNQQNQENQDWQNQNNNQQNQQNQDWQNQNNTQQQAPNNQQSGNEGIY